jgi:hypothetical protein
MPRLEMCKPSPARLAESVTPEAEDDDVIRRKLAEDEEPSEDLDKDEEKRGGILLSGVYSATTNTELTKRATA